MGFEQPASAMTIGQMSGESTTALAAEISAARGEQVVTFGQQLGKMFSVNMPESVNPALLSEASGLWQSYWLLPAFMATGIGVVFFIAFWDRNPEEEMDEIEIAEVTPEIIQ